MLYASWLQAERKCWKQEPHSNEQCEASGSQVLPTEVWTRTIEHVPNTVRTSRQLQMPVARRPMQGGAPDTGISLPPMQPMEGATENALERGGKSTLVERRPIPTRANLRAALHGEMR